MFVFFTSDGWSRIFEDTLRMGMPGFLSFLAIVFFFILYVVGNLVIVNLFRATLMREFDQKSLVDKVIIDMRKEDSNNK